MQYVGDDPDRLTLLFNVVQAAIRTNLDDKIRLLGKALAEAVLSSNRALIDQQALLIATIAELEAPHIEILQTIADGTKRPVRAGDWSGISEKDIVRSRIGIEGSYSYSPLQPILHTLVRNGLIYQTGMGAIWDENMADDLRPDAGTNEWAITIFGRSLLGALFKTPYWGCISVTAQHPREFRDTPHSVIKKQRLSREN